ncbi:MAG: TonB family protein [Pyrinomonadaceae bacterium]
MRVFIPIVLVLFISFTAYSQSAIVLAEKANVRQLPSAKSKIVGVLDKDTQVGVVRRNRSWSLVRWSGIQGWLHRSTITKPELLVRLGDSDIGVGGRVVQSGPPVPGLSTTPLPTGRQPKKHISGGVLNGKATSLPKPAYPAAAKAIRASGSVNVQVLIDESGRVISASAVSGHPLLRAAAVSAAQAATFSPTRLSGQPVKVSGIIAYNFVP